MKNPPMPSPLRTSKLWILWLTCSLSLACFIPGPEKTHCLTTSDCLSGRTCRAGTCEINGSETGAGGGAPKDGSGGGSAGGGSPGGGSGGIPEGTCANPKKLMFSQGTATDTASTTGAANNLMSTCRSDYGDIVYTFSNPITQPFTANLIGQSGFPLGTLYLRTSSCLNGPDLTCAQSTGNYVAKISVSSLAPGPYFLVVDGQLGPGGRGNYVLQATLGSQAIPGDTCSNPKPLTCVDGGAVDFATTLGAGSDLSSTCKSDYSDIVYTFTNPTQQPFTAILDGSGDYVFGTLYLRAASCTSGTDLACSHPGGFSLPYISISSLDAGTYFLVVDGEFTPGGNGAYSLSAKLGN